MCGIIGTIGYPNAADALLQGLRRLEYRGYDSAGIAVSGDQGFSVRRAVGKLNALADVLSQDPLHGETGIGHTRWATHGGVNIANAHPMMSGDRVAVVHNGIIENHRKLRQTLSDKGYVFQSQTDTEVLAHLFADALDQTTSLMEATEHVIAQIEGAYAFAVMVTDYPDHLAIARQASPLAIGLSDDAVFVGSDAIAMGDVTQRVIFLKDGDYGTVTREQITIKDASAELANRDVTIVAASPGLVTKEGYQHFMEKEIHEQPDTVMHTLGAFSDADGAFALPDGFDFTHMTGLAYLAAGTSYNAGLIGRYWMEQLADLPVVTESASEFRYRQPSCRQISLALGISQSGESLDTLMALRYMADKGVDTAALVNVETATMARESGTYLLTRAGPEIGVASTKSYMAQLAVLLILATIAGHQRGVLTAKRREEIEQMLASVPRLIGEAMASASVIKTIVPRLAQSRSSLYLGRGTLYPLAMEGALKLKELSYIHAEAYASGEMKHGPIALIEDGLPVVALLADDDHLSKSISNVVEAKARGADIIIIATESAANKAIDEMDGLEGRVATVPDCDALIAPLVLSLPIQFLAYLTAVHKGTDVDQPRNLAKSVTVE
ncbi:MAG: glutamine--fructose-6-phosphate transaminase (isomerizing) [Candidatus Puniceispirillales bacterium]